MSEIRGVWESPEAQKLLVQHAKQQMESGLFDIYSRHIGTLAMLVRQPAGESDKLSQTDRDDLGAAIQRWSRAEVPLVPYYVNRGYLCGLWIGRLDEQTGTIFTQGQAIVASMKDAEIDAGEADDIELSGGFTADQFNILADQVIELDELGLKPRVREVS